LEGKKIIMEKIKELFRKEQYVKNVEAAQKKGLTYLPELYKDCKYRDTPRIVYQLDIFLAGGWRDK
jgi:hypothetical protein